MENITLGQIVTAIGTLSVLVGFFIGIYKFIKKVVLDKINQNTMDIKDLKFDVSNIKEDTKDIKELKFDVENLKKDNKDSKEERLIMIKGLLACLKGLKEQGCNGPVTQAINNIEEYLMDKSHD